MEKCILTIVVPCYNVEKYVGETLESIFKCNTVNKQQVIAVNDGSIDNTLIILQDYKEMFNDLVIVNKPNGGHGSTINSGLEKAKGKYFCVIDGDDWIDPEIMDELISFLENCESEMVVTGHTRDYINTKTTKTFSYSESPGFTCGVEYLNSKKMRIPMTDICYRTDLLRDVNLRIQENTFYVDEEYCIIPFLKLNSICFFSRGYYHYRIGEEGQSISPINTVKRVDSRERVLERLLELSTRKDIPSENYKYIKYKLVGLIKTVLEIYYIRYSDKRLGAIKGSSFYGKAMDLNSQICEECRSFKLFVSFMNHLPLGRKLYGVIKKTVKG